MDETPIRADVIIVGAGLAGLATALELLDRGRSVAVLDRCGEDGFGGLARRSFGGIFIVGSREQRRTGIRDSVDLALRDWLAYGELGDDETWPRRWAEAYVAGCRQEVYDWLRGMGVRFVPVVHWVERGLHGPGNSVPRFHMVWGTGERLVELLRRRLETHPRRRGLRLCWHHRVADLVQRNGRFAGCRGVVETPGPDDTRDFTAEGDAVVIAAGGIMGDLDRVRRHWPRGWGSPPRELLNGSHPAADGRLHDVAADAGARVTHLDRMWLYAAGVRHWRPEHEGHGLSLVPPKSALWLSWRGERLGPPAMVAGFDTRYLVETIAGQERRWSWQVMNRRIARRELAVSGAEHNPAIRDRRPLRFLYRLLRGNEPLVREFLRESPDLVAAADLAGLAAGMNELAGGDHVDPQRLRCTVRRYDETIARGSALHNDDQLRRIAHARRYRGDRLRTCKFAPIDDPGARPLIALRERLITRKSLGGIQTDLQGRALERRGEPMPGLYAVGEAAGFGGGGMHGIRSLEGTFLGGCIFGGRAAGRAIARG